MVIITFPDGVRKEYNQAVSCVDICSSINKSLLKSAIAAEINNIVVDLSTIVKDDVNFKIITLKDNEALEVVRHSTAHLLAHAVKELFPDVQVTIGPVIKDGFYYDFATNNPFSTDDLEKIEKKMQHLVKQNQIVTREVWERDKAIEFFQNIGEFYKAEIIKSIPQDQEITLYRQGNFIDLCRGPHVPSTNKLKHFKLTKVSGAYWKGDSKNEMLQRIYGTAWLSKEDLDKYLHMLSEAEKRDHRKLGKELDLFHIDKYAPGMPFWHENGWTLYRIIQDYLRKKLHDNGYFEVKTPTLLDKSLWEKSGHYDKFKENMYFSHIDEKVAAIKPMNCPCHVQIFKQKINSYKDLPIRMAEFGSCYRNEPSGSLHGLMRVRSFVQDDAHIFCTEDQINEETSNFCKLLMEIYDKFGFKDIAIKFSTRPDLRAGDDKIWDKAESSLIKSIEDAGYDFTINEGEGAFYGPKLEFILQDALGREWQCGTLQLDFVLPERLDANYIDDSGNKKRPVMLHRAILGSFERFIAILLEHYSGILPIWLAPTQVSVLTFTNSSDNYARDIYEKLTSANIRSSLGISSQRIEYKIRQSFTKKIPILVLIGEKERKEGKISIRKIGSNSTSLINPNELINNINNF